VGLPLTSGPIALFLALDYGAAFAVGAAGGSLLGAIGEAAFCLVYAGLARDRRWPTALVGASVAFGAVAAGLRGVSFSLPTLGLGVFVVLGGALWIMPRGADASLGVPPPRWDIPARMAITTVLVLLITEGAPLLGPRMSGILATFPVYAATLTVFSHRSASAAAVQVLRGLLLGLFAFAGFFIVLGVFIERVGVAAAFAAAIAVALAIQAASLGLIVGRGRRTGHIA
jgi:hypothetical protein